MSAINDMALYLAYERGYEQGRKEWQRYYQDGYDKAVDMACAWLEENYEDIGIRWLRGDIAKDFVERFKRAIKNDKH